MKRIITCLLLSACCCIPAIASPRTDRVMKSAEKIGLDETQLSRLRAACDQYDDADKHLHEMLSMIGIRIPGPSTNKVHIKADVVPKEIREMQQAARKYHNRFEMLEKTIKRWGPSTNLNVRAARQSMQSRLNETRAERDAAKVFERQVKELKKAAQKDTKNLSKLRKDLEKYRDKAETEDFKSTCQQLLDLLPTP